MLLCVTPSASSFWARHKKHNVIKFVEFILKIGKMTCKTCNFFLANKMLPVPNWFAFANVFFTLVVGMGSFRSRLHPLIKHSQTAASYRLFSVSLKCTSTAVVVVISQSFPSLSGDVNQRQSSGLKPLRWMACAISLAGSLALWRSLCLSELKVKETSCLQARAAEMLWQRRGSTPEDIKDLLTGERPHCVIKG